MSHPPRFSVIIPVFNQWELTKNCLHSLKACTPDGSCEVLVVDNGSTDATRHELAPLGQSLFGASFRAIRFPENKNFGPACNAGAHAARSPLVLFLNNDTLLTPGWSAPLLAALDADSRLGAVGPLLLYDNDTVQHLGVAFSIRSVKHLYRSFPAGHPLVSRRRHFQVLTGAALLMPKNLFLDLGGFYPEYRNGFEDIDLCLHLCRQGRLLSCIPESVVYHLESRTPGRRAHDAGNIRILQQRCGAFFKADLHILGQSDGLEAFVDDFFDIALRMPAETGQELLRQVEGKELEAWTEVMRNEPLWCLGRDVLAQGLEQSGLWHEALPLRKEAAALHGTEAGYQRLLRAAVKTRDDELRRQAEENIRAIRLLKEDRREARDAVARALTLANRAMDAELEAMFMEKLRSLG